MNYMNYIFIEELFAINRNDQHF